MDPFQSTTTGLDSPAGNFAAVAPDDNNDLPFRPRAVWVGGSGNLQVIDERGATTVIKGVMGGTLLPIRPLRITSANTTATDIVALW